MCCRGDEEERGEAQVAGRGKGTGDRLQGAGYGLQGTGNWRTASISQGTNPVSTHFSLEGTVSSTDMDRVTDSREKCRSGIQLGAS